MHILIGQVASATAISLLHFVDAAADNNVGTGRKGPLFPATRHTTEKDIYRDRLGHRVEAIIPPGRIILHAEASAGSLAEAA